MSERSGLISLDKGKRRTRKTETKETGEPMTETTKETVTTITLKEMGMSDAKIDELAKRLTETDSTMAVVSQRQEVGMANLNTRVNEHYEKLADLERRLSDEFDKVVSITKGVKDLYGMKEVVNGHELRLKSDQVQIGLAQKMIDELRADLTPSIDKLEELDVLRDKVRSQEAIIAELESKVAKLETDVGETFAEAGRMIRDVKDESTQRAEEIAKEMETRLMVRSQEETDEKLKEATRIQNKDITVMKQKMENVFSRMKRVEEDPTLKAIRLEAEQTRRDARAMMWVSAGSLLTSMAVALVMVFRLAGGF